MKRTFAAADMQDALVENVFHFLRHSAQQNADKGGVKESDRKSFMGHKTVSDVYSAKENVDKLTVAAGFVKGAAATIAYHVAGKEVIDEDAEGTLDPLLDEWENHALGLEVDAEELANLQQLKPQAEGWNKKTNLDWIRANRIPTLSRMAEIQTLYPAHIFFHAAGSPLVMKQELFKTFCAAIAVKIKRMREVEVQRASDAKEHAELSQLVQRLSLDLEKSEVLRRKEAERHEQEEEAAKERHAEILAAIASPSSLSSTGSSSAVTPAMSISTSASASASASISASASASSPSTSSLPATKASVNDDPEHYRSVLNPQAEGGQGKGKGKKKKKQKEGEEKDDGNGDAAIKEKIVAAHVPGNNLKQEQLSAFTKLGQSNGNRLFMSWVEWYTRPTLTRPSWDWLERKDFGKGLWRAKCETKIRTLATRHLRLMKLLLVIKSVKEFASLQEAAEHFDAQKTLDGKSETMFNFATATWKDLQADEGNGDTIKEVEALYK